MTDIFTAMGVEPPNPQPSAGGKDIFQSLGIAPPTIAERNAMALGRGVDLENPQGEEAKAISATVKADMDNNEVLARTRFTQEQIDEFKNNPVGFWDSFKLVLPGVTAVKEGVETYGIYNLGKKLEAGESLTDAEQNRLNEFVDGYLEESLRGRTIGGYIAYGLSEMPAFAAEFALSGGVGKAASMAAVKGAKKYTTAKVASMAAAGASQVAARSLVFAPRVGEMYAERRVADSMTITDKGELILKESQESPAKSALLAYGYTGAEVASEMMGGAIGKYLLDPVRGVLKTPLVAAINKLPVGLKSTMYQAYKKINPSAEVSRVFTAAGWNGMLEEMGEERVSAVMQGFISLAANDVQRAEDGQEFTAQDFFKAITPTGDELLIEAGIIGIAGGVKTSADISFNLLKNRGVPPAEAKVMVENMSAIEQENLVDSLLIKPQSSYSMPKAEANAATQQTMAEIKLQDVALPEIVAESDKGGYYNVPQNADTALYAAGIETQESYAEKTVLNTNPEIGIYEAATKRIQEVDPPPINNEESMSDKLIKEFRNDLWPIHKMGELAKEQGLDVEGYKTKKFSPVELATRMYSSAITQAESIINHSTFYYDREGRLVNTGKSLKKIMDDFDNYFIPHEPSAEQRRHDFSDYLIARRYLGDLLESEDIKTTEENRLWSLETMMRIQEKYGDETEFMDVFAKELYDYQARVVHDRLVQSGVMSQEDYDKMLEKHKNYIPYRYVVDEALEQRITASSPMFSNAKLSKAIKKMFGTERSLDELKSPLDAVLLNTAKIVQVGLMNDAARQIYNYKDVMPEYVQAVDPPMEKTTAKVKVTYDKRLREKLTAAIEFFGNQFEQKKTLNKKGQRGYVRGDYNPQEKLVRLRLGSSDAVLAHEVGHMLDFSIGLGDKMLKNEKIKAELTKLAEERLATDTVLSTEGGRPVFEDIRLEIESDKHKEYVKNDRELIANLFDAYVNAPDLLKKIAPTAKKEFDKIIESQGGLEFIKDIKPSLERAEEVIEQDVWTRSKRPMPQTIVAFIDGKPQHAKVSKGIYEAVGYLSPAQLSLFEKLLILPTKLFRSGATLNPEFMARAVLREGHAAFLLSRDVKFSPADYAKGFFSVVASATGYETNLYKEFSKSARFSNYYELSEKNIEDAYGYLIKGDGWAMQYVKNPLKVLEHAGMKLDQIPRVGIYEAARRAGFTEYEASLISRDIFDYSRGGSFTKKANHYIPFFRAGVNGSDKLYRALKDNPVETAYWTFMTVTLPSLALASYYLYQAPEDERNEWLEINDNLFSFATFYKEDGEWKRIPKPFQVGQLFGTMPELAMRWMHSESRPEGAEMAKIVLGGIVESASPVADWSSVMPLVVKLPAEWVSNYNFFYGKDIYPSFLDGKDPALRSNPWTSETAKLIGEQLNVSPAKVDNLLRGQLAGSAYYVTKTGDWFINSIKEFNGQTVPQRPITPSDVMLIRAFAQRRPAGFRSNSYQIFRERYDEVSQRKASLKDMKGEERAKYMETHAGEIAAYKPMNAWRKQISNLGKELNAVYEHESMTSEEKVERINALEDQITEIARQANIYYNKSVRQK